MPSRTRHERRVRYAVVGLGHIAQAAMLPAFRHARRNSEIVALFSDDPVKLRTLARRYRVEHRFSYDDYEAGLAASGAEAVYIALPNSMHREYAERAARVGVHVLCEKPLADHSADCAAIVDTCAQHGVKLMVAYRLHFDLANLRAVELANKGKLGETRIFASTFTMQVKPGNVRLQRDLGGGPLFDIGIYCINAARYLFRAEPTEAFGALASGADARFVEVPEMASAVLRFPGERLASFVCSFGAADSAAYDLIGTRGRLRLDPAYEYAEPLVLTSRWNGRTHRTRYPKRDQFAPELLHFSDCILHDRQPEPSGLEGSIDVAIIEAIQASARGGQRVRLDLPDRRRRPEPSQGTRKPPVPKVPLVRAASASQ
jgi:predicted dehydrogenase